MPNTTNFNWPTPADTDLVKDGAAAIRNLGNGIDTSLIDLKGGTTGQILSKASNADMDFTFITPNVGDITEVQAGVGISIASGTGPIPVITNSSTDLITTAGDLLYGTAADTVARLGIGTAGQVLKVNSGATAPEWGAPAGGGLTWTLLNTGGTALTGAATITVSGISNIEYLQIIISGASSASGSSLISYRFNGDSGNNYDMGGPYYSSEGTYATGNLGTYNNISNDKAYFAVLSTNASSTATGGISLSGGKSTGNKAFTSVGGATPGGGNGHAAVWIHGVYKGTAAISSVSLISGTGNFDAGTMYVWGA